MIVVINLIIMFGFVYFAARGVKATIHHIRLMKYVYSNARLKQQAEAMATRGDVPMDGNIIYIRKQQPKPKKRIKLLR